MNNKEEAMDFLYHATELLKTIPAEKEVFWNKVFNITRELSSLTLNDMMSKG